MTVHDPRDLNDRYNDMFRAGDLEGMMSLYEQEAILCPAPGQEVRGYVEIKKRLGALITMKGTLTASAQNCIEFENYALLHACWHFAGESGDGKPVELGGTSSKLARRGLDGAWRYVMDVPISSLGPPP